MVVRIQVEAYFSFPGFGVTLLLADLSYYLDRRGSEDVYRSFEQLTNYSLSMKSLVAFRDHHILVGQILLAVFGIAFLYALINRAQKIRERIREKTGGEPFWRLVLRPEDACLLMALMLTAMYYQLP